MKEERSYRTDHNSYNTKQDAGRKRLRLPKTTQEKADAWTLWIRRAGLMVSDLACMTLSGLLGLMTRFEFSYSDIDPFFKNNFWKLLPLWLLLTLVVFWIFRLYHSLWQYAGSREIENVLLACGVSVASMALLQFINRTSLPRSFYPVTFCYSIALVGGLRVGYRKLRRKMKRSREADGEEFCSRIIIVGAGAAGLMISREIRNSGYIHGKVSCFVDDDRKKIGNYIDGILVAGGREDIPKLAEKYEADTIIIAMPSQSNRAIREILEICNGTDCQLKIIPGVFQLVNGDVGIRHLRDVQIEDLLERDPIHVEDDRVGRYITDKVVMVTGGGGSIGSELCRQIMTFHPRQLIVLDIYENNAYDIQQELMHDWPDADVKVLIGSVRNTNRMHNIFRTFRPQIVFHAAAHKHVPLMEVSPDEAVKNNVFGTFKTVKAADKWGVEKFVLISSDKAVNPTNVMGATKRLCEMIIQVWNARSKTEFVAVRFGNVLGSNGSVIPLFRRQIEQGGPVTVTHPDIIRYFMTIPEAVGLVLTAAADAKGGEIFVLDMGEPVKIDDLARNMIRLSGLKVGEDIDIVYTGLRSGEKLYEELLMDEEGLQDTPNHLIHIARPISLDEEIFEQKLAELEYAAVQEDQNIREKLVELVPTYHPEKSGQEPGDQTSGDQGFDSRASG